MPYLDYNATTPVDPNVLQAMLPWLGNEFGNPSSDYPLGQSARRATEDARQTMMAAIGAKGGQFLFTGCGTEANNLAILGTFLPRLKGTGLWARIFGKPGHLVISAIEHPATSQAAAYLKSLGFALSIVPVDGNGFVNPEDVKRCLRPDTLLVSIMHANNEIGSIQPLKAISQILKPRNILLHTDAAQTFGKIKVEVDDLGVDLLSLTAHKFYAPKGIGGLWIKDGVTLSPILFGGGQEKGLRSGTENVAFAVGMAHGAKMAVERLSGLQPTLTALRERLWNGLESQLGNQIKRTSDPSRTLPNTLHFCVKNQKGGMVLHGTENVQASTGSACHAGEDRPSAVLCAMKYPWEWSLGSIRLSLGANSTPEEVDDAARQIVESVRKLSR